MAIVILRVTKYSTSINICEGWTIWQPNPAMFGQQQAEACFGCALNNEVNQERHKVDSSIGRKAFKSVIIKLNKQPL